MAKIAVVWPWKLSKWAKPLVRDGLIAAIDDIIAKEHEVTWYLGGDEPKDKYDWIFVWGVSSVEFNFKLDKYHAKKGLFCAGHAEDIVNLKKFDVVFVESPAILDHLRPHCWKTVLAFGTDTDFFKPIDIPKHIDALYPATWSAWKRQQLFGLAVKERGLAFGVMQVDGSKYYDTCLRNGTASLAGLMPTCLMPILYNSARTVVLTSWHGSERTALEAMACNVPVVITEDNVLTASLVPDEFGVKCSPEPIEIRKAFKKALKMKINSRDYILDGWSHRDYADKILKEINE